MALAQNRGSIFGCKNTKHMKNGHGGQSGRPGEARKLYHNSKRKGLCKGKCHVLLQHDAKVTSNGSRLLKGAIVFRGDTAGITFKT
ncbi:hypothetical protein HAV15_003394 [Penicillium sp. str. |nr:hypothetical protein HAV15_003394 [Penicillium sp. str. \